MARKGKVEHNLMRKRLVERYRKQRATLREKSKDIRLSPEQRLEARMELARFPRNSSETRIRNRCGLTGRPRAYYRKFNLSRIALRELALRGELPGVTKSSW